MGLKAHLLLFLLLIQYVCTRAQTLNCNFKKPVVTIHFGSGNIPDVNLAEPTYYERVGGSCPTDGHYTYTSYTSDCFRGDWQTLEEDHTPGDASGNMLIVNSAYTTGVFFQAHVPNLQGGKIYEFGVWLMNVCRITDKCPFPLLPNLSIKLVNPDGKIIAQSSTGEVIRQPTPKWTQYRFIFTLPTSESDLRIIMVNNKPGGCGNDFAMDDITFRECIKVDPPVTSARKTPPATKPSIAAKDAKPATKKPAAKAPPVAVQTKPREVQIIRPQRDSSSSAPVIKPKTRVFAPPPPVLTRRTTTLAKQIETETGDIKINLYDNGEIDGDTVSIYHNNILLISRARISGNPLTLNIKINKDEPHHELVMVAENLGSIPPNTSLMVITAGSKRYEVFISASEQKNAKVVFDLRE